jgi:hypothetical protein
VEVLGSEDSGQARDECVTFCDLAGHREGGQPFEKLDHFGG